LGRRDRSALMPVEVVARGPDELGGPRQVLADVAVIDRRHGAVLIEEQPREGSAPLLGVSPALLEVRHQVAAGRGIADGHEPGQMIDARRASIDLRAIPAEDERAAVDRLGDAVTQADCPYRTMAVQGKADPV